MSGAGARHVHLNVQVIPYAPGQVLEAPSQLNHHLRCCSFLRPVDRRGAVTAEQGIPHIAQDLDRRQGCVALRRFDPMQAR